MALVAGWQCHALSFLGGVPLPLRVANLKTGVKKGAWAWAEVSDTHLAFANELGFLIDATRPRRGSHTGNVERRV